VFRTSEWVGRKRLVDDVADEEGVADFGARAPGVKLAEGGESKRLARWGAVDVGGGGLSVGVWGRCSARVACISSSSIKLAFLFSVSHTLTHTSCSLLRQNGFGVLPPYGLYSTYRTIFFFWMTADWRRGCLFYQHGVATNPSACSGLNTRKYKNRANDRRFDCQ
jgi:hypothetical protein